MATVNRRTALRVSLATVAGFTAALGTATPALAATGPTISAPASRTGFGTITITGKAQPGALVRLYESAISWNDMRPAADWESEVPGKIVTTNADRTTGMYKIVRYVDTGFMFAVRSSGVTSPTIKVLVRVLPALKVSATGARTVDVNVDADPNQPNLPVKVLRANADGTWTIVTRRLTDDTGVTRVTLTNQPPGSRSYRAWVGGDSETGIVSNYSNTVRLTVK
jgi:hypothetical protein